MEIYLSVYFNGDGTFRVYRQITEVNNLRTSVLKLDYQYIPWPREGGNLLWS